MMLPAIRPTPHPLLPGDSPQAASAEPADSAESSRGSELAQTHGSEFHFSQHPASVPDPCLFTEPPVPPKIENRSDSGQFRSENPQPLILNTPHPWNLQPNEPPVDYSLFAAWLQLPAPRRLRKAASALGCSLHRLRRLSTRHNWKTRAAAFDQYRASTSSRALDQFLRDETRDWKERVERFRIEEWLLHEEMIQAAFEALHQLRKRPGLPSLGDLLKIIELASRLGRLACGMPLDPAAEAKPDPPSGYPDAEAALLKIYGPDDSSKPAPEKLL
jgi:hypothetical protein